MAQAIQCDAHGQEHLADWLVTHIEDGESLAYCNEAYQELMVGTVRAMDQAEADQAAAEAERHLAAAAPARPNPRTAKVVRRGTSAKARTAREKAAGRATVARARELAAARGPDDDEDDDKDEAAPSPAGRIGDLGADA
jgi:hypothetical protein